MINFRSGVIVVLVLVTALPAAAQWTPVSEVPAANMYSVWAGGATIAAGSDSTVHVSGDGGATWKNSTRVAAGVVSVQGARVHNGRLYAGTYGQGVFVSDDLGDTWLSYNQGLVGGIFNTQLFVVDMLVRGDSLYLATSGDGPWVRNLVSGTWTHFSNIFEPNQASNMNAIDASPTRLLACAGFNGTVFFRDNGQSDWTLSWLDNTGIQPGLAALAAAWTGSRWVVASNVGVFHSAQGQSPWTPVDLGLGTLLSAALATRGGDVFAAFGTGLDATIEYSSDGGATWHLIETLPATFIYELAVQDNTLYAARADGLWRRSIAAVATKSTTWGGLKSLYRGQKK